MGTEPVIADALDAASVKAGITRVQPDAVINELTSLPGHYTPAEMRAAAERDHKVRTEGNANLLAVLQDAGVRRYAVLIVKIDHLDAEPGETRIASSLHIFRPAIRTFRLSITADVTEFGREHDVVASTLDRPPAQRLIVTPSARIGRVFARVRDMRSYCLQ